MTLATSFVVLFNCYATADILTKFLHQCFLFSLLLLYLGNSQVSVYRTIGPTLVLQCVLYHFLLSLLVFAVNSIIIIFCDQNGADFVRGENSDPSHCLGRPRLLHFIIF